MSSRLWWKHKLEEGKYFVTEGMWFVALTNNSGALSFRNLDINKAMLRNWGEWLLQTERAYVLVLREKYGENNIWLHGTKVVEGLVDGER